MKCCFDVADDIRSLINVTEVIDKLTGSIHRVYRPGNGKNSDIVINVLSCDNYHIQTALVNIRIHIPNEVLNFDGVYGAYPDQTKFDELTDLIIPLIDNQYRHTFWTEAESDIGLIRQPDRSYFKLIKVTYRSIQENFNNI